MLSTVASVASAAAGSAGMISFRRATTWLSAVAPVAVSPGFTSNSLRTSSPGSPSTERASRVKGVVMAKLAPDWLATSCAAASEPCFSLAAMSWAFSAASLARLSSCQPATA